MSQERSRIYRDKLSLRDKLARGLWNSARLLLFYPTPQFGFNRWRLLLLRQFGAKIGKGCSVAPTCAIWAPWNLVMGNYACLGPGVDCYNVAKVELADYSTVSQRAFFCTASHDISNIERPLVFEPISLRSHAWVCAEVFVGPGVTIGEGAVAAARSVVISDVEPWSVVAGNPARKIKERVIGVNQAMPVSIKAHA